MSSNHLARVAVVALVVAAGCGGESLTEVTTRNIQEPIDLELAWPAISPDDRTISTTVELDGTPGPAGALGDDEFDEELASEYAAARILSPITEVGFTPAYAYSRARHSYVGNVGSVSTEAVVTYDGEVLGSQPASQQDATPFLLDWGSVKSIVTEAYVFSDVECGLTVDGSSMHEAWWQWFLGGPAPSWGAAKMSSQAFPPAAQPACDETEQPNEGNSGSGGGGSGGGGTVTCWYRVTYDPYTGEVFDAYLLYCDEIGG